MGRSGIRRRKPKRRLTPVDDAPAGIIEDLEDQAAWSSYGQNVPRLGNPHRDAIWWNRGFRFYRGLADADKNPAFRNSYWWIAVRTGGLLVGAAIVVLWLVFRVLGAILD